MINVGTDWYCFAYCHVEDRTENMKIRKHRKFSMFCNVVQYFSMLFNVVHLFSWTEKFVKEIYIPLHPQEICFWLRARKIISMSEGIIVSLIHDVDLDR